MIKLENIDLKYAGRTIFDKFNLNIERNEKLCIKGKSGIGKSSLLDLLMGFQLPDSGRIFINDTELNRSSVRSIRSQMSWLPQSHEIFHSENVFDAVLKPFSYSRNKADKPDRKVIEELFEKIDLGQKLLDSQFKDLSGGEKQRIGLVICKLLKRPILLLDEPTAALDKETINKAIDLILKDKATILSVSHEDKWIESCDRTIELNRS